MSRIDQSTLDLTDDVEKALEAWMRTRKAITIGAAWRAGVEWGRAHRESSEKASDSVVGDVSTTAPKVEGTPRGGYTLAPGLHEKATAKIDANTPPCPDAGLYQKAPGLDDDDCFESH